MRGPGRFRRLRFGRADLARGAVALLAAAVGITLADAVLPGISVTRFSALLIVALVMALLGAVMRPLLVALVTPFGWLGAAALALLGQGVVVYVALLAVPDVRVHSFWWAVAASWIVAAVSTLVIWTVTSGSNDVVVASLLQKARRARPVEDPDLTGVVFVQLDGVPFPVMQWGVLAGTLPTLARWIRSGDYRLMEWTPKLPATTPASQLGILHGTMEGIPAFRWVERSTGRVFVANRSHDAADIEAAHSDGRGLLADGGVSVSNLFSGDAPVAFATMSSIGRAGAERGTRRSFNRFLVRPEGFARGLVRTVSEVGRERFQARRQVRQDMRPRVHRGWSFAGERAVLNGILRDFNTVTVAQAMLDGARAIYVDYVDYDAVAHHAGIMRPESLDALVGLDAVLAQLEQLAASTPRRYRIVVLSDHGQSQGEVFADRYGEDLAAVVERLAHVDVAGSETNIEGSARIDAMVGPHGDVVSRAFRAGSSASDREAREEEKAAEAAVEAAAGRDDGSRLLVFGSGNLGLVFVAGEKRRLTLADLRQRFPALVPGLVAHPGVSFVVVEGDDGPVVLGEGGEHHVRTGEVVGEDPLAPFGADAPAFVLRAASMPESPDVLVNSLLEPTTGEVAAFEGLVGCHGGLGGWQDRAMLIWPEELPPPPARIVGAEAVHHQLVSWLEHLGHRRDLPPAAPRPYDATRLPQPRTDGVRPAPSPTGTAP